MFILALLMVSTARGEDSDSLQIFLQRGDSLMEQYNTYEALKYYQQAFDRAQVQGVTRFSMDDDFSHLRPYVPEDVVPRQIRLKLADCQYKRSNYRETTELLKNMPEDSLTHDAFRQLAYGYKHQGDNGAFMYWASQLLSLSAQRQRAGDDLLPAVSQYGSKRGKAHRPTPRDDKEGRGESEICE